MAGPQISESDTFFQQCKECGQAVQMRQVIPGQWLAYDDEDRIHDCHNQSAYNDTYIEATRTLSLPASQLPRPTFAGDLPTTTRLPTPQLPTNDVPVAPPAPRKVSVVPWFVGAALLVLLVGWFASSRITLRPLGTALSQGPTVAPSNPRADDPAHTPTAGSADSDPTSAATLPPGQEGTIVDLQTFNFIYVRSGPDIPYPEVARIYAENTPFTPVGRSDTGEWIFGTVEDGTQGWVMTQFLVSSERLEELPLQENIQPEGVAAHIDLQTFDFIYVQQGPTPRFDEVSRISDPAVLFEAIARSSDDEWIFVQLQDGTLGWIKREFVVSDSPLDLLPIYESHNIGEPPSE